MKKYIFILFLFLIHHCLFAQQWNRLNNGGFKESTAVFELAVFHDSLYIGGGFSNAGPDTTKNLATYDSLNWKGFLPGLLGWPNKMLEYDGNLVIFGQFFNAGGNSEADHIVLMNGNNWTPLTGGSIYNNGEYNDLVVYDGNLIAIGPTEMDSINNLNFVAKWNGSNWSGVGGGVTGGTTTLNSGGLYQNELYVGGLFYAAGGTPAICIAKYNGFQWKNVGNANGQVQYMLTDTVNDVLYTCGYYNEIGGVSALGIAKYDGENWYSVGGGLDACGGWSLELYQNQLYVAGCFLEVNGDTTIKYLSRFNGQNWKRLTTGVDAGVFDLQVYKEELYVGGGFTIVGDTAVNSLARWSYPLDSACATMYADILPHPDTLYLADAPFKFKSGCYGNSSLQWNFSDGFNSTIGQPTYNFNNLPGTYTIDLIAYCGTTSDTITNTVVVVNNVGVDELNKKKDKIEVYPNPANEIVFIKTKIETTDIAEISIYDITGKLILSQPLKNNLSAVDIHDLAQGVYSIKVTINNESYSNNKLVITK